jgi:hypothetical protein
MAKIEIILAQAAGFTSKIEYKGLYNNDEKGFIEIYCNLVQESPAGRTVNQQKMLVDNTTKVPVVDGEGNPLYSGTEQVIVGYQKKNEPLPEGGFVEVDDTTKPIYEERPAQSTIGEYDKVFWEMWDERNPNKMAIETAIKEGILRRAGVGPALQFVATPEYLAIYP